MKRTYCNPLDLGYRYQHFHINGKYFSNREGADPTLILFKDTYYMFVSMSAGFWYSDDLLNWQFHANPGLLITDYAPDMRQIGEYLYFCASRKDADCPILRTTDPLSDQFEQISAPFPFWDPNLFADDDGRVYFYWGCNNTEPTYGVEMNPQTMLPVGEKKALIAARQDSLGYECCEAYDPFIEGSFMNKYNGKYYLQYANPGTEYPTYNDGVYVSDHPLGPFTLQSHNPFSSKPGGFIAGAGHGSTIADKYGNFWHASTMRISVNHKFERRVGLFPAGFDEDGILFCNQNFADYPIRIPKGTFDPKSIEPEWMLLSYHKPVSASSTAEGSSPSLAVNEDIRTWWSAAGNQPGEWLTVDLEKICDIRAIQVNTADQGLSLKSSYQGQDKALTRVIELQPQISQYTVEASQNGTDWTVLEKVSRECSNAYFEYADGIQARFIRVTGLQLPYGQVLRISGLRIFGNGEGALPEKAKAHASRCSDRRKAIVTWQPSSSAQGYNIRYGIAPDKLYCSWMVYDADSLELTTLISGQDYYLRVDSFNENGIVEGDLISVD